MEMAGQWLEKALLDLCKNTENGLDLDGDLISGLVSYCELASPVDAKEYLDNIVGQQAGKSVIGEYLKRRGYSDVSDSSQDAPPALLRGYVKPPSDEGTSGSKKMSKTPKDAVVPPTRENRVPPQTTAPQNQQKGNQASSKKKKTGKVISLAEASKGSIVFQQGKPCSCQARRHRLISNCLSCGKIICEQEGEGPCSFCGALVLREGSTYAGLEEGVVPLSDAEAAAEAYAKRLVDYDRNSAARTNVIDDQSDYYEIEGNSWLSMEEKELLSKKKEEIEEAERANKSKEKELLSKKKEEIEEAERANKSKVIMTIDLLGRKVLLNEEDEASDEIKNSILFQPASEREANRIKPNPTVQVQPVFVDPGPTKKNTKNQGKKNLPTGMCLVISGRVQHDDSSALKVL